MGPEGGRPGRSTQAVNSIIMSGFAPKQNAFKFKITPHKSINPSFLAGIWAPWPTGPYAEAHLSTMVNPALLGDTVILYESEYQEN